MQRYNDYIKIRIGELLYVHTYQDVKHLQTFSPKWTVCMH